ncbi:type VII secretion protein EssA [Bacillus sp. CGMCC 1.16541]|uniref:type VII secretion protein EssA n=1 Tax=Bacillus sp. CGMCC 1.16541 TaxID=2185143 RepID=UPI0013A56B7B|nr:type VII secretion protein EssA [Bacillus sp. CGMCC 1.16541]
MMVLLFIPIVKHVAADNHIEKLQPNEYKENTINLDPRSSQQEDNKQQSIPEEFRDLTFERKEKKEEDQLQPYLFTGEGQKKSTLSSQVDELNLFSSPPKSGTEAVLPVDVKRSTSLKWVLIAVVAMCIALLFAILLPRLMNHRST